MCGSSFLESLGFLAASNEDGLVVAGAREGGVDDDDDEKQNDESGVEVGSTESESSSIDDDDDNERNECGVDPSGAEVTENGGDMTDVVFEVFDVENLVEGS